MLRSSLTPSGIRECASPGRSRQRCPGHGVHGATVVEPTASVAVGNQCWRRLVVHHRSSVFSGLSCSWLDRVQSAMSLAHPDTFDENSSTCDGEQNPQIWVSSAYWCRDRPCFSISAARSATYKINRICLSTTEPCGTPHTQQNSRRRPKSVHYGVGDLEARLKTPYVVVHRAEGHWQVQKDEGNKMATVTARKTSDRTRKTAVSVEWPGRKPCRGGKRSVLLQSYLQQKLGYTKSEEWTINKHVIGQTT